jgi:cell division protease FtsH
MKQTPKLLRINIFYLLFFIWLVTLGRDFIYLRQNVETLPYSQFLNDLDQDKVAEVKIGEDHIEGTFKNPTDKGPKLFATLKPEDPTLIQRLEKAGVKFEAAPQNSWFKEALAWVLPIAIMFGLWSFFISRFRNARTEILSLGKSKARIFVEKDLKTRFTDVAGVDEVKEDLEELVNFLKDPKSYSRLGGRMPKGVLLVGPPGTGKTLLARAVAGESGVPFFSINGSEFVEMFVGLGAARVRDLFEQARKNAPCIIFIDELDALGKARGINALTGGGNDEKEQTLNQLLAELDGFDSSTGVILLAATNRPEVLDPALLRSGRFDRQILVDKPDRKAREAILAVHIKKIVAAPDVNIITVASLTAGFSGADLANLVNEAALIATRRRAPAVDSRDFTMSIERIIAGLERKNRVLSEEEKRRVAFHEMGHAVVALEYGRGEAVHKVSIIPRGLGALGYTFRRATDDKYLMSKEELEDKMAILLGGRASEVTFLHNISTGAADDLDKATEIARAMVTRYGMGESLGLATLEHESAPMLGGQGNIRSLEYSQQTAKLIDNEVKSLLDRAFLRAKDCISHYRGFVNSCTELLLKSETLEEEQLKELWTKAKVAFPTQMPNYAAVQRL